MGAARALVERLFAMPGESRAATADVLHEAAVQHSLALRAVAETPELAGDDALEAIVAFVDHAADSERRERLLDHPLLVDCLRELAEPGTMSAESLGRAKLGNVALGLLLAAPRCWRGSLLLAADAFGGVHFPFSDWSVVVPPDAEGDAAGLPDRIVRVEASRDTVVWRLADPPGDPPLLVMSRQTAVRLLVANDAEVASADIDFPHPVLRPRLQRAVRLGHSPIRYDPVAFCDAERHAGVTGAIVEALVKSIECNSPPVYRELCAYVQTIRGFGLPRTRLGSLESFSTPMLPGVMGINIAYSADDDPLLDPFCFTWLGHELGHTKNYLIDDAAALHGWRFVANPADMTHRIARYDRALPMRTVFQVPYVHLYEWVLLMDFIRAGFHGLPWRVAADPWRFGDDLADEIGEAFELIERYGRLTQVGRAVVAHLERLYALLLTRWRTMRRR